MLGVQVIRGPTRCYELVDEPSGRPGIRIALQRGELGFKRRVAIKSLSRDQAHAHQALRTLIADERLLRHPNLLGALDVVVDGDTVHVVMDHIGGPTLADVIGWSVAARRRLPLRVSATIIHDALLGMAHLPSTIHRDVSAQTVIVGSDGMTRLVDVGLPGLSGAAEASTDLRSDVHSCGVLLWELLTGARLFDEAQDQDVMPPSARSWGIPPKLDALVMKALARDPVERSSSSALRQTIEPRSGERFATATAMAHALSETLGLATRVEVADAIEALRLGHARNGVESVSSPSSTVSASPLRARLSFSTRVLVGLSAALVVALVVFAAQPRKRAAASASASETTVTAATIAPPAPPVPPAAEAPPIELGPVALATPSPPSKARSGGHADRAKAAGGKSAAKPH